METREEMMQDFDEAEDRRGQWRFVRELTGIRDVVADIEGPDLSIRARDQILWEIDKYIKTQTPLPND